MRLKELQDEKETLKSLNNKYKIQFEDVKEKLLHHQEMNFKLNEQLKALEQKNCNYKYQLSAVKNIIRDKNNEISILKEELISVEFFKNDKDKFTTQIKFLEEKLSNYKGEMEKKTKRLRELEKQNTEFKLKSDEYLIENQLIKKDNPHKAYIEMLNEKQRIIRKLEKEILILRAEIAKHDKEFQVVLTLSCKDSGEDKGKHEENNENNVDNNKLDLESKREIRDNDYNNCSGLGAEKKEGEEGEREEDQEKKINGI